MKLKRLAKIPIQIEEFRIEYKLFMFRFFYIMLFSFFFLFFFNLAKGIWDSFRIYLSFMLLLTTSLIM